MPKTEEINEVESQDEGQSESKGSRNVPIPRPEKTELTAPDFFRFWQNLSRTQKDQVVGYAYRIFPHIDPLQPLTTAEIEEQRKRKRRLPSRQVGKMYEPLDPEKCYHQMVAKWGAGDYSILLNDNARRNEKKKTVVYAKTNGEHAVLRDWENFPPVINYKEVILTEDSNQPYIRWARLNGVRFPGDPEKIQERQDDEDMANEATVAKLTDALIKQSEKKETPKTDPGDATAAASKTAEVMGTAANSAIQMVTDAAARAQEMQAKTQNPLGQIKEVAEVLKDLIPKPEPKADGTNPIIQLLMSQLEASEARYQQDRKDAEERRRQDIQMMHDNHKAERESLMKRLESMEQQARDAQNRLTEALTKGPASQDPLGIVKTVLSIKKLFTGDEGEGAAVNPWIDLAQEHLPKALDTVGTVATAIAGAMGARQPQPQTVNVSAQPVANGEAPRPAAPGGALPNPQEQTQMNMKQLQARQMGPFVIEAIDHMEHGAKLAGRLLANVQGGEAMYRQLLEQGVSGLLSIFQSAPEVWSEITRTCAARYGNTGRIDQFAAEFLDSNAAIAEAQAIRAQTAAPQPPVQAEPPKQTYEVPGAQSKKSRTIIGPDGRPIQAAGGQVVDISGTPA